MKPCSSCGSSLYSEVKYCPFCGTGTAPNSRVKKGAVPAPAAVPVRADDAIASQPQGERVREQHVPAAPAPTVATSPARAEAAPSASEVPRPRAAQAVPQAVPARGAPASFPVETERPVPKKSGTGKWIVIGVVLLGLFMYFKSKPNDGEVACNAAFEQGNKALQAKDLAGARLQATTANGVCVGSSRNKATSLQAAIDASENTSTACLRSFRGIESHLDDHKLASARAALNELSSTCSADVNATALHDKLTVAVATAQGAQAALRTAIDNKDLAQAKTGLQQLANINRENPDLPGLKKEVDQLAIDTAAAATAETVVAAPVDNSASAPAPPAAPVASTIPVPRPMEAVRERAPIRRSEPDNSANAKTDMAASFLHDAETALAQKKFDAARTYVDSARRMDPGNPRLDSLMQQIRDRERQVLQQETIIR